MAYNLTVERPLAGTNVIIGVPLLVSGTVTGRGGVEPDLADNVNVGFDGNTPVAAALNPIYA